MSDNKRSWLQGLGINFGNSSDSGGDGGGDTASPPAASSDDSAAVQSAAQPPASASSDDSNPPPQPQSAPVSGNGGGGTGTGPDSDDYKQGYQDGLSGADANPVPRDGDALVDYNEGYAKGHYEWTQQHPSSDTPPPPSATDDKAAALDQSYRGWLAEQNWQEAAEALNGFNAEDIKKRLSELNPDQIANLHKGAIDNPRVGPQSQVAQMTNGGNDAEDGGRGSDNTETLIDLAKSKGLVVAGEMIGKKIGQTMGAKLGGIIGYAVDLATSPGGDTSLPHAIYQAAVLSEGVPVPVPGAEWHRRRENAERDAKEYTDRTGQETMIDVEYTKDEDDPD